MLHGKKVSLKPFEEYHIGKTVKWFDNIEYSALTDRVLPTTTHERKEWLYAISKDKTAVIFAITTPENNIHTENDIHIGNCGLINIDCRSRRGQLWIYLDNQYTNQGIGKETITLLLKYAFHYLNLNRVYLYVVSSNPRAIEFYKNYGFKIEGTFRQHIFLKNKYEDAIWFGILKEDFDPGL